ncbi:Glucose-1-phosphate thymidylyltransferase [Chlamydiales bacterium SCGC AB-751-O23]|jgi:glucose-1-phosphate thymidylyltransferase|nr:Glucose-1-phosphate thymidylyltransferase [Chlamydiales bacterium SCGC AB-751-O23]
MKGIILAGGSGTRLYPSTQVISKQLLPIYNKPMIYYPLSVLMLAGIQDILLISTPDDIPLFQKLLQDGSHVGLNISYATQESPKGIAEALIIGESFLNNEPCMLILGDNIFYGHDLPNIIEKGISFNPGVTLFAHMVSDPARYGVLELGKNNEILSLEEKPSHPKSNLAATGLYIYDNQASQFAKELKPSDRGELEITDLNKLYMEKGIARAETLGRGFAWLDTGTHASLLQASQFVETLESRQGTPISCIEEIAYYKGFISSEKLEILSKPYKNTPYGQYLNSIITHNKLEEECTPLI